jgi:hypothetical protein
MSDQTNDPPIPPGAQASGWEMTPYGRGRSIRWDPIYVGYPDAQGEQGNTVCITAMQAATGRLDMFGVEIDVAGSFSTNEAGLIAASIRDAVRKIEEFEEARQ